MVQQQYERVAATLRERIEDGTYPPGSKMPTRRELREEFGASDTVIDKAMMILRAAGLTETLPGVGVYARTGRGA
jgi:DNA-binding FadR family transcriptional regulator